VFIEIQKARRAKAEFDDVTRGVAVYSRIFSTPSPAVSRATQQEGFGAGCSTPASSAGADIQNCSAKAPAFGLYGGSHLPRTANHSTYMS
jgi:hypothetical protein